MAKAIVKWFNRTKGFGFLLPETGGKDIFVHASGLADKGSELKEGDTVTYDTDTDRDGRVVAVNVR